MKYYYCSKSYPSKICELYDDDLKSEDCYKIMLDAKKNGHSRFKCKFFSSGYLWSANVYFKMKDAVEELIEKKYEWIGKKELEKQELINEILKLKDKYKIS